MTIVRAIPTGLYAAEVQFIIRLAAFDRCVPVSLSSALIEGIPQ